jgi:hypothetical protein
MDAPVAAAPLRRDLLILAAVVVVDLLDLPRDQGGRAALAS